MRMYFDTVQQRVFPQCLKKFINLSGIVYYLKKSINCRQIHCIDEQLKAGFFFQHFDYAVNLSANGTVLFFS